MSSAAWGSLAWILNCYGICICSSLELGKLIIASQREVSRRATACLACFSCGRWLPWGVPIFISSPLFFYTPQRFVEKSYNSKPPRSSSGTHWFPVMRSLCLEGHTCIGESSPPWDYLHLRSVFTIVNIQSTEPFSSGLSLRGHRLVIWILNVCSFRTWCLK